MALLLAVSLLAGLAGASAWRCPARCHCLPDTRHQGLFKLSCHRGPEDAWPAATHPTSVSALTLTSSSAQSAPLDLSSGTLAAFTSLRKLHLIGCQLKQDGIGGQWAEGLGQLEGLRMDGLRSASGQPLTFASDAFAQLPSLQSLSLVRLALEELPSDSLCGLNKLNLLNLSSNSLAFLSATGLSAQCQSQILILDLSFNRISELSGGELSCCPLLNDLDLGHNSLGSLPEGSLAETPVLRSLRLASNRLSGVEEVPSSLSRLDLSNNSLRVIPAALSSAESLSFLNLSRNELDASTPFLLGGGALETVDLSENSLESLPPALFGNASALRELFLAGNGLAGFGRALEGLTGLRVLDARRNSLTRLEASWTEDKAELRRLLLSRNALAEVEEGALSGLGQLRHLDLSHNLLLRLPLQLPSLYHLRSLSVAHNLVQDVTKYLLDKLPNLRELDVSGNRLSRVPRYVFEDMAALEVLSLQDNVVEELEPLCFARNPQLHQLSLQGNLIGGIEDAFQDVPRLRSLNLSRNAISFADFAMLPASLEVMDLSRNGLASLTNIASPPPQLALRVLDVSHNNLSFLGPSHLPSASLRRLNASHNQIREIEEGTLQGHKDLQWLDLRWNELSGAPREALDAGLEDSDDAQSGPEIFLSGNPFECSCQLEWLQSEGGGEPRVGDRKEVECSKRSGEWSEAGGVAERVPVWAAAEEELLCTYSEVCSADCLCCDFDSCDCKAVCPDGCRCSHDAKGRHNVVECRDTAVPTTALPMYATHILLHRSRLPRLRRNAFLGRFRLRTLRLNDSGVRALSPRAFAGLQGLTTLDLSHNHISHLPADLFAPLKGLQELLLHHNELSALPADLLSFLPSLRSLSLHGNDFRRLPAALAAPVPGSGSPSSLSLAENPFLCDCGRPYALQRWLPHNVERVRDSDGVYCAEEAGLDNVSTVVGRFPPTDAGWIRVNFWTLEREMERSLCGAGAGSSRGGGGLGVPLGVLAALGGCAVALLCGVALAVGLGRLCRRRGKTAAGKTRKGPPSVNSSSGTTTTPVPLISSDAFVSYAAADGDWVVGELVRALEAEAPFHHLCLLHRDLPTPVATFNRYHIVNDELSEAMRRSSALLIVVSPSFLSQEWTQTQIKVAHLAHLKAKASKVIFVLLGLRGSDLERVDPELGVFLRTSTLLHARDALFWQQLRDELPPPSQSHSDSDYSHLYYGPVVQSNFL